eukprot:gene9377-9540_t
MPGTPGNSSSIVAQPPSRFRAPSSKGHAAPDSEPTGARPVLIGLPPPRPASNRSSQRSFACREPSPANPRQAAPASPAGSDTSKSSAHKRSCLADNVAIKDYEPLGRSASLPVIGHGAALTVGVQQQVSVTELVNLAARAAEIEEKHFDGQAGCELEVGGKALVAVKFLEDSTEIRRLRRNTWPENQSARREALEAAAREQQQQQQQSSLARAIGLLQEPAKLFDWRDKLKELQQERRQQRLGIVQAGWQAQQQQLAAAAEDIQGGQWEDMDMSDLAPGKDNSTAIVASQKQQEQAVTPDSCCIPAAAAAAVSCSKLGGPAWAAGKMEVRVGSR